MNLCVHELGYVRDVLNEVVKVCSENKSRPKLSVPNLESWRVVFLVLVGLVKLILGEDDHLAVWTDLGDKDNDTCMEDTMISIQQKPVLLALVAMVNKVPLHIGRYMAWVRG